MIQRVRAFFEKLLGSRYAAVVSIVDRAVTGFLLTFLTKLIGGDAFDVHFLARMNYWETAAAAGLYAALSVVKSSLMVAVTGTPALLSLVSSTLRARRSMAHRPDYHVPLRPPKRRTKARARVSKPHPATARPGRR